MSDLGIELAWSALQVTLLGLMTAALAAAAGRRNPAAGAAVIAAGLAGCAMLTLMALCPVPAGWAWAELPTPDVEPASPPGQVEETSRTPPNVVAASAERGRISLALRDLLRRLPAGSDRSDREPSGILGWGAWAWVVAVAATLGVVRLLAGLWAVSRCRRRSRAVDDLALCSLVGLIQKEIGYSRPIPIREADGLGSPATVGWLRPVVLLPADWRDWGEPERRAALAHEIAHVRRRDSLAVLAARIGVALHFYHPLLHGLVRRLTLQQELAADALAAPLCGGPAAYLRSLARLALRPATRAPCWPAVALFSRHGTLMRRIDMLRAKDGVVPRTGSARVGPLMVGILAVLAVGVSALRGPAQKAADSAADAPATAAAPEPEPFDLQYMAPEVWGAVAFRPAQFYCLPGMKRYAKAANQMLNEYSFIFGDRVGLKIPKKGLIRLPVEEVSQITGRVVLDRIVHADPQPAKNTRALYLALQTIRATHDFDWKGQMNDLMPGAAEVAHAGKVYFKLPKDFDPAPPMAGLCYYLPDARTIVFDTEDNLRRLIERKGTRGPARPWDEAWGKVNRGLFAFALDNRDGKVADLLSDAEPEEAAFLLLYQKSSWMVAGASLGDAFRVEALGSYKDDAGAEKAARAAEGLLKRARSLLEEQQKSLKEGEPLLPYRFGADLLRTADLRRHGPRIRFRCETKETFEKLIELTFDLKAASVAAEAAGSKP
jgi:beta-lactamase regulating signal transducer with metallopeptidase domain